jgi:hypothetical protein
LKFEVVQTFDGRRTSDRCTLDPTYTNDPPEGACCTDRFVDAYKSQRNAYQQSTKQTEIIVRRKKYNSTPNSPTSTLRQITRLELVKPL